MQAVGLITEYNPFHNGHLHHLRESLRLSGADVTVAVMSGHFLQRGEPALVDKWLRTEMALAAGVDLVVELPLPWACSSAQTFALGAVQALERLGGVTGLCFGSEAGELEGLAAAAELLVTEEEQVQALTAAALRRGETYPESRACAAEDLLPGRGLGELLREPNNILGIAYLEALRRCGAVIQALTLQRIGAGYHQLEGAGGIASATGIRALLRQGRATGLYLPQAVENLLRGAVVAGMTLDEDALFRLLMARLLGSPPSPGGLWQFDPGLMQRLQRAARESVDLEDFFQRAKPRHLTRTRLQRLACYLLLDLQGSFANRALARGPLYLHLLGASRRGQAFLAASRKLRQVPLVQNYSRIRAELKRYYGDHPGRLALAGELLELELRATRLYGLLQRSQRGGERNRDFVEALRRAPPVDRQEPSEGWQ